MINPKKDCFAYDSVTKECSQIDRHDCKGCRFYKTWEQFEADREKARGLLRAKGDFGLVDKYI